MVSPERVRSNSKLPEQTLQLQTTNFDSFMSTTGSLRFSRTLTIEADGVRQCKSRSSSQNQFSGREIIEANPRSRAAGQFGAQKGDGASKRLTRRPATHHHAPDSRARPHATADWLRMVRGHLRGLNMDNLRTRQRSRLRTWSRSRTGRGADTFALADWSRPDRGCGHRRGHLPGQIADSPRLFRGRKNLVLTRSKACPVQNR